MTTLFLVDATYELFRAYFGAPPKASPRGREVGATTGVLASMIRMIRDEGADFVACATDHVIRSFRNDLYAGYKTDGGIPEELSSQFPLVEEGLAALGLVVWPMIEFEADDALATAATKYQADFEKIHICTVDKDLAQCVRGARTVMIDRRRGLTLDESGVNEKFGVPPGLIPDFLALVGDSADGYPGIPGFGKVAAAALLRAEGTLESIFALTRAWRVSLRGQDRLAQTLRERREDALLFKQLATLRLDVPLKEAAADLAVRDRGDSFAEFATEYGMESLVSRYQQAIAALMSRRAVL